jgi:predicted O-linked N-acetylglucosamine transferase (SPINDLY family)
VRIEREVQRLVDRGLTIDVTDTIVPTNFYAAYQGLNDLDLQRSINRLYRAPQLASAGIPRRRGKRIRVGFLSSHFCDHTIGCLNIGRVTHLDRQRFEVTVIAIGVRDDMLARSFKQHADQYVAVTGGLSDMRSRIAALDLDMLIFADVGMNTTTYTLALSRLAPVQCVTWGHPVTTGNPTMDYFISSDLLETPEADAHYSERLVRLKNLGTYYFRPEAPPAARTREHFGLDPRRHVYLCTQTLFKLHPDFDPLVAEILRHDPLGDLVLLGGRHAAWTDLVRKRFARTMPDVAGRVQFLGQWPRGDFLHLNRVADVSLDTLHFGGGNTTYEALAVGTPVVTLPGPYMRSRIALALYRKMNLLDCVADSPRQYIDLAVRLGTDRQARRDLSIRIERASTALYEDAAELREFERFLTWAAEGAPGDWQVEGGD